MKELLGQRPAASGEEGRMSYWVTVSLLLLMAMASLAKVVTS